GARPGLFCLAVARCGSRRDGVVLLIGASAVPRKRTTKKLAQRIELQYFTKPHPLRTTRFWRSIAVPVLAVLWLAWRGATSARRPYSNGAMSAAHAVFSSNCAACHVK